jgi:hypothetical protein
MANQANFAEMDQNLSAKHHKLMCIELPHLQATVRKVTGDEKLPVIRWSSLDYEISPNPPIIFTIAR